MIGAYVELSLLKYIGHSGARYMFMTFPSAIIAFVLALKSDPIFYSPRYECLIQLFTFLSKECSLDLYIYHMLVYNLLLMFASRCMGANSIWIANSIVVSLLIISIRIFIVKIHNKK